MVPDCAVILAPLCRIYSRVSCVWNFRNRCIICHIDDLHASLYKEENSRRFPVLEGDLLFLSQTIRFSAPLEDTKCSVVAK